MLLLIAAMAGLTPPPVKVLPTVATQPGPTVRLDLGLGGFVPVGTWAQHVYAGGVKQFASGPGAQLDVTFAPGRSGLRFFAGLGITYQRLSTRQWVGFVADQGNVIRANAHLLGFFAQLGVSFPVQAGLSIEVSGGPGVLLPSGREQHESMGIEFDYTFLEPAGAGRIGTALVWEASASFSLRLAADFTAAAGGVRYFQEERRNIMGAAVTAGARFRL